MEYLFETPKLEKFLALRARVLLACFWPASGASAPFGKVCHKGYTIVMILVDSLKADLTLVTLSIAEIGYQDLSSSTRSCTLMWDFRDASFSVNSTWALRRLICTLKTSEPLHGSSRIQLTVAEGCR